MSQILKFSDPEILQMKNSGHTGRRDWCRRHARVPDGDRSFAGHRTDHAG